PPLCQPSLHTATPATEIYTLSLHDALPILAAVQDEARASQATNAPASDEEYVLLTAEELDGLVAPIALYPDALVAQILGAATFPDRKSTRLNSSHVSISYAVFCLKKKNFNC